MVSAEMVSAETEITEDCVRHAGRFDLEIDPFDLALCIDDERVTHHPHVLATHEFLQAVAFVAAGDRAGFGIGQKREGQFMFADEFGVGRGVVLADPEYVNAGLAETVPTIPEVAGFLCAAGGVVFRVEVQDDPMTPELLELNGLAILIGE